MGARVAGAVVRALASRQYSLDSNPGVEGHHMWVMLVVNSFLCSETFSTGYCGYPLFSNPVLGMVDEELLRGCVT